MHVLLIGVVLGFVIGAVLGGGPLGLLGMFIGGGLGAVTGGFVLPVLVAASADEYARHPHIVECPATGEHFPVMVGRESARAAAFQRDDASPSVVDCPRWRTHGRCNGPCAKQLHV